VGFAWKLGITGSLIALPLSCFAYFLSYLAFLPRGKRSIDKLFPIHFDRAEAKILLQYSALMTYTSALSYGILLAMRGRILEVGGAAANGILQVPLALSAYGLPFLTNGVWGFLHPKVSGEANRDIQVAHLMETLKIVIPAAAAYAVLAMLLAPHFIPIFYSKDFLADSPLLPWQFSADFSYLIFFALSVYALAVGDLSRYFWAWTLYFVLYLGGAIHFLPDWGLSSVPKANLFASSVTLLALMMSHHRYRRWSALVVILFVSGLAWTTLGLWATLSEQAWPIKSTIVALTLALSWKVYRERKRQNPHAIGN
jgi:hypothetical protein